MSGDADRNVTFVTSTGANGLTTTSVDEGATMKAIGIFFIAYGVFFFTTAICGLVGACNRNHGLLSCYIGTQTLVALLTIAGAIWSIVTLNGRKTDWKNQNVESWNSLQDADKDFYQWEFNCCGYDKGDKNAYTGTIRFYENEPPNFCAPNATATTPDPSTYSGCHDASQAYWTALMISTAVAALVSFLFLMCSIGAAHHARRMNRIRADASQMPLNPNVVIVEQQGMQQRKY
ncbi:hypothetical protein HK101_005389 [Irineochytrium annulatum]|nr:hypothetical protein HK101_005389 [Irineochytrium annulatum]